MRKTYVYTISIFRGGNTKHYILTKDKFRDSLAVELGDTDYVGGWCGITTANYGKADYRIKEMKKPNNLGLLCTNKSYRIFDSEEFERHNKNNEYALYLGDTCDL